ncbi:MAG: photosynthetic reaction center subunit H [Congregibacter sp.]
MGTGAITEYIDVAQLALYGFWLFFFGLIGYMHREGKREGYPTVDSHNAAYTGGDLWGMPEKKTYVLPHGQGTRTVPVDEDPGYELHAEQTVPGPGFPLEPTGDPMKDGVGPASWAIRPEKPDLTWDGGKPRIIPLRVATEWSIASRDPDPRGRPVYGTDGEQGGIVSDVWVDLAEPTARYIEIDAGGRRVMMPMTFARVKSNGDVHARSVCGRHFADAPSTANPDFVTLQEEDKIGAYYGGGTLYALPERAEPIL